MRRVLALLLVVGLAPGTWLRAAPPQYSRNLDLRIIALPLPPEARLAPNLGPFRLEASWQLRSRNIQYGGYSALVPLPQGRLLAISDRGYMLRFSPPGSPPSPPLSQPIYPWKTMKKANRDAEGSAVDPKTGTVWISWENRNAISRHDPDFAKSQMVEPAAMRDWGVNTGPETLARLADGRFVSLCEGFPSLLGSRRHEAVIFAGDPIVSGELRKFTFEGPAEFSPTAMAQLPDGRVLILMRRLVWPMPPRFAGRIVVADPAEIRAGGTWRGTVVARLTSSLPIDNFEGIAIRPRRDGKVTVWLISDDNNAVTQRTLLWKLALDPAELPWPGRKARS